MAAVFVKVDGKCEDARIVLGAVPPGPHRAIEEEEAIKGPLLDRSHAEAAAEAAVTGALPLAENAYKVTIARALVKRALLS